MQTTRRAFLKSSAVYGAALSIGSHQVLGANDTIQLGVIGIGSKVKIGGKGKGDIRDFRRINGVRVASICDCDARHLEEEKAQFGKRGERVKACQDFRRMLEDPEIDAVSITTPNHWHSLMAIMACQAGKDVFVQKPMSHNLFEGRKVVDAMRRYHRIVQATHGPRNSGSVAAGLEFMKQGHLGSVQWIHGINYKPRGSIGLVNGPQPIPPSCDYDLWCGPASLKPLRREYLHYDWHWDWETGNGDLGNMGIHFMDGCRWALGANELPRRVCSIGGRFGYEDDGQTPNTMVTFFDYDKVPIIFEVRGLPKDYALRQTNWSRKANDTMDRHLGIRLGVIVHGEKGYLRFNSGKCAAFDHNDKLLRTFSGQRISTKQNFIDCLRNRNASALHTDALEGHLSCGLVHLANISYRIGSRRSPQETLERNQSCKPMTETMGRMFEHLEANRIDSIHTPLIQGAMLTLDPETEQFSGEFGQEANMLVSRNYREPFVVPEKV